VGSGSRSGRRLRRVGHVSFTATTSITDTATAAFVWSYGQLLNNWNRVTGLVRDKAKDASGEFDAIQATAVWRRRRLVLNSWASSTTPRRWDRESHRAQIVEPATLARAVAAIGLRLQLPVTA